MANQPVAFRGGTNIAMKRPPQVFDVVLGMPVFMSPAQVVHLVAEAAQ